MDDLFPRVIEEPEEQAEAEAQDEASDYGEVEGGVLTAMDDVAGKTAETERKFCAEEEQTTNEDEPETDEQNGAAEFAERVHREDSSGTAGAGRERAKRDSSAPQAGVRTARTSEQNRPAPVGMTS